jgi:hypothetical protein
VADADFDPARLHGLGHLAHQIELQQPVLERRAFDLNVVGKAEVTLERTGRSSAWFPLAT